LTPGHALGRFGSSVADPRPPLVRGAYRPSKKSIKRMVEKIHVLTERKGTWQDTTELVGKLNRSLPTRERKASQIFGPKPPPPLQIRDPTTRNFGIQNPCNFQRRKTAHLCARSDMLQPQPMQIGR